MNEQTFKDFLLNNIYPKVETSVPKDDWLKSLNSIDYINIADLFGRYRYLEGRLKGDN